MIGNWTTDGTSHNAKAHKNITAPSHNEIAVKKTSFSANNAFTYNPLLKSMYFLPIDSNFTDFTWILLILEWKLALPYLSLPLLA